MLQAIVSLASRSHVTLFPAVSAIRDGNSALFAEVEVAAGLSSIRAEKETIDLSRINRRVGLVVTRRRGKSSGFSGFQRTHLSSTSINEDPRAWIAVINAIIVALL